MEKLCLIGLMVFVSIFGAAYCSEEVVGNGKDINTEAVVADSLVVSIPLEKQDVEKDANGWASVEFVKGIEGIAEKEPYFSIYMRVAMVWVACGASFTQYSPTFEGSTQTKVLYCPGLISAKSLAGFHTTVV